MRSLIRLSLFATAWLLAADASAQQPAQPAQVPDAMPFDVPYGASITAARAAQVVQAVIAEATKAPRNWKLAIAVVDTNGELVYFYKMDQTQFASINISQGKARTAVRFRRPTQTFFDAMQQTTGSYYTTLDPTLVASPGGVPIVEGGRIIGALGCSGATGAQDHVACSAGAATVR
jgi:glc operon protein GlcG